MTSHIKVVISIEKWHNPIPAESEVCNIIQAVAVDLYSVIFYVQLITDTICALKETKEV